MGSASQPMLVVKANRALLRKRKSYADIRKSYIGYVSKGDLKFKELIPFEQKKIRDKIIQQIKEDRLHNIKISLVALFILSLIILSIYLLLK